MVQNLFFPRGEIPGYRHTQRAEYIDTHIVEREEESGLVQVAHQDITLTAKGRRVPVRYTQSYGGQQGPVIIPGRQDPTSKQRPSPGGQRPSPARAPTRTSRRAGIGQGDLPHTKVATSASRMHGNYKEQYGSHSLNRWKERLALEHRHAGMSTGSEPYKLRGILSKGLQALMTRLSPSHDEGPGTQPTK